MQTPAIHPAARPILPGIQLLRGMAAFLVVAAHTNLMMGNPKNFGVSPYPLRDSGTFGVAVFFVISGFIIANVSLNRDWRPRLSLKDYAWRRYIRIMPFLWVSVIAYNALSYFGTHQIEWMAALRAMVLWPVGDLKPNAVWSLQHELIFYLLFAAAMFGARRHMWILFAWFAAPVLYALFLQYMGPHPAVFAPWFAELLRVVLLGGYSGANVQFGAGFLLGLVWLRSAALSRFVLPMGLFITLAVLLASAALIEKLAFPIAGLGRMFGWSALAFIVVLVGVTARASHGPLYRIGMVLGNASFSIYMVHNAVVLILFKLPGLLHGVTLPLPLWFFLLVTAATMAGVIVHYLVEVPLIDRLSHGHAQLPWQRRRA
jgi:exopolysaccharide production protein ExoZ